MKYCIQRLVKMVTARYYIHADIGCAATTHRQSTVAWHMGYFQYQEKKHIEVGYFLDWCLFYIITYLFYIRHVTMNVAVYAHNDQYNNAM